MTPVIKLVDKAFLETYGYLCCIVINYIYTSNFPHLGSQDVACDTCMWRWTSSNGHGWATTIEYATPCWDRTWMNKLHSALLHNQHSQVREIWKMGLHGWSFPPRCITGWQMVYLA